MTLLAPPRRLVTCSPRWATPRNPERQTHGGRVAKAAQVLGWSFMPWQQQVSDVANEIDPATGHRFYRTVVLSVMRQQGKTTLTLPTWVERCASWPDVSVAWTMQTGTDAREKWLEEHVPKLLESPLASQVSVRKQNGSEHVKFSNGSIQRLMASGKSSGHGKVVDLGMIDEAMAQPDDRLHQALRPAMKTRYRDIVLPDGSVRKLPGAQLWIISTVGPAGESEWFHSWMDAGRQAVDDGTCERDRIAYFEWSAPEDADPFDPAVWWASMPALGYTIDEETVRLELAEAMKMPDGLASFQRQGLNIRGKARRDPPIPLSLWDRCVAPDVERGVSGLVFAVDVSPEQASASIGVAWRRPDGVPQVQLVERREGVGWLAGRVSELRDRWGGVWLLDPRGASGSQDADWPGVRVKPGEARRSCAELEASVREGTVGHYAQPELRAALEGAVKRPSEEGGWFWARNSTVVDISPLVAVTLALGGVLSGVQAVSDPLGSLW